MQLIVECDERMEHCLRQCGTQVKPLVRGFFGVELEEQHLEQLGNIAKNIEINTRIYLGELDERMDKGLLEQEDIILAVIGAKQCDRLVTHWCNMEEGVIKPRIIEGDICRYTIACYSENNQTDKISLIKSIRALTNLSKESNKPLIIYANINMNDKCNIDSTLFYQILYRYLAEARSILVVRSNEQDKAYEPYGDCMLKTHKGINEGFAEAMLLLKALQSKIGYLECYGKVQQEKAGRQEGVLYSDYFYLSIDLDEEIYVPLLAEAAVDIGYYEGLGVKYIRLESGLNMLYGRRGDFDRHSEVLRPQLPADYRLTILTHAPCIRDNENPMMPNYLSTDRLNFTGRGVYIGIITTDDIDYTQAALRTEDGSTRIDYIWEQQRADEGRYYTKEEINAALRSPNPGEVIRLPVGESVSTMMAAIAGGWSEAVGYRGIAAEAEFLVAKIRPVSAALQRIYGGMPSPNAIILHDAIIGMFNLANYALREGKPLVLIMPFNGNIDSHDAALTIQKTVSLLARRINLTLIVPVGDEADKGHHYSIEGEQVGTRTINLRVEQPNQNVVGVIYQWGANMLTTNLYPPTAIAAGPINLKLPGMTQIGETIIYSTGENISFFNGTWRTMFRMQNPGVGQWRIESEVRMGIANRIEMWISQEELNPYVRLNPYTTLSTMGSTSAIPYVMSVGAYNINALSVLGSSGRGDLESDRIIPMLVTYGKSIIAPCMQNEWAAVTGTLPAASIMAGAVATLYQKYRDEGRLPLPNTIVMSSIIIDVLMQFDTLQYPNPSQGYGIFRLESLFQLFGAAR